MSFFENTRKPVGLGGKIMVAMMNFGQYTVLPHAAETVPQRQGAGHRLLSCQRGKNAKGQCQSHCGRTVYRAAGKCGRAAV